MQLAFFNAKSGNEIDHMVAVFTHGPYSHVELTFSSPDPKATRSFSAKPGEGVRFATIDITQPCWTLVALPATAEQEQKCDLYAKALCSKHLHYDWLAIVGFILPFGEHDAKDGEMCSEVDAQVIEEGCGLITDQSPWRLSPNELYKLVTKHG